MSRYFERGKEYTHNRLAAARAVGRNHVRRAGLGIVGSQALVVNGRDGHGVDAVRIPVEVALVTRASTISATRSVDH